MNDVPKADIAVKNQVVGRVGCTFEMYRFSESGKLNKNVITCLALI